MNLDQIKYLLAIAEYGSLTAAARHLSVSQQALSKYLSGLEQAVGCPLFERHKRQLRPTAAGARYLKSAGEISSINYINENTCPMAIFHGDEDVIVPYETSEKFYEKLCEAGLEDQTEFYAIRHGGHGTRELFQNSVKEKILDFFKKYL